MPALDELALPTVLRCRSMDGRMIRGRMIGKSRDAGANDRRQDDPWVRAAIGGLPLPVHTSGTRFTGRTRALSPMGIAGEKTLVRIFGGQKIGHWSGGGLFLTQTVVRDSPRVTALPGFERARIWARIVGRHRGCSSVG